MKRGVPLRLELGPRDLEAGTVSVARRDQAPRDRRAVPLDRFAAEAPGVLGEIQDGLLQGARKFRDDHTVTVAGSAEFEEYFRDDPEAGFAIAPLADGAEQNEEFVALLKRLKVSARCILGIEGAGGGRAGCRH